MFARCPDNVNQTIGHHALIIMVVVPICVCIVMIHMCARVLMSRIHVNASSVSWKFHLNGGGMAHG